MTLRLLIIALAVIAVSVAMTYQSDPGIVTDGLPPCVEELMQVNPD